MFYKKIMVLSAIALFVSQSMAYDTQGKFGMGIKIWGTPVILLSTMKIGLTNTVGIEPSIGYYDIGTKTVDDSGFNGLTGETMKITEKIHSSFFLLSNTFEFKPVRTARSNLIIRAGASWGIVSSSYETDDPASVSGTEPTDNPWIFSMLCGIGIEHFFTDYFAADVGITSGFVLMSSKSGSYTTSESLVHIGNQLADFSLVWYLK
jgi:hypothetical protein